MSGVSTTVMRVRIRYSRHGKIRFTSHRDVARLIERALRKLRLPVAYSEGFSPRPKISFGLALSVGHESDAEYLDVDLTTSVDLEDLPRQLTAALPDGLRAIAAAELEPGAMSLQQVITSCRWFIEVLGASVDDVAAAVSNVLASPELPLERERKGKTSVVDVRPAIRALHVVGPTDTGVQLDVELATETVSLRPSELVRVLGEGLREGRVRRTHQFTTVDGVRSEPLPAPDPSNAPAVIDSVLASAEPGMRQAS